VPCPLTGGCFVAALPRLAAGKFSSESVATPVESAPDYRLLSFGSDAGLVDFSQFDFLQEIPNLIANGYGFNFTRIDDLSLSNHAIPLDDDFDYHCTLPPIRCFYQGNPSIVPNQ
jgi:hypothetical protein